MDFQEFTSMDNVKVNYIRNNKREKIGMLVSGLIDNEICVGWSLCKNKMNGQIVDTFSVYEGFDIAEGRCFSNKRMEKYIPNLFLAEFEAVTDTFYDLIDDIIPSSIHKQFKKFVKRIKLYYKDKEMSEVTEYIYNNI